MFASCWEGNIYIQEFLLTHLSRFYGGGEDAVSKGDIIIEDDVWIGHHSIILSGVTIARGTVVAAGSVVVKSTAPYSIVGGNPAREIKKRFPDEIISKLLMIKFDEWDKNYIQDHIEDLYRDLMLVSKKAVLHNPC